MAELDIAMIHCCVLATWHRGQDCVLETTRAQASARGGRWTPPVELAILENTRSRTPKMTVEGSRIFRPSGSLARRVEAKRSVPSAVRYD